MFGIPFKCSDTCFYHLLHSSCYLRKQEDANKTKHGLVTYIFMNEDYLHNKQTLYGLGIQSLEV